MAIYRRPYKDASGNRKLTADYHYDFTVRKKRYQGSTGCATEREAKAWEKERKEELRGAATIDRIVDVHKDHLVGRNKIALADAFEMFVKARGREKGCEQHVENKGSQWMDFIKFIQAKHPAIEFMHSVTEDHAKQYFGHLQRNGKFDKHVTHKNDKNLSARTVNIYLTNLKQIFKELARDASIAVNPFAAIKKLSHKPAERDLFSDDELKKIWSNPDAFLEPLFQCSYNTGLREGDICTLRKDEIDLVDGDGWINRKTRKTGKDVEIPVFGDDFRAYLEQSIDWNSESPFAFPKLCTAYHKSREKIHRKLTAYFKALKITGTQTKDKKLSRATNRKGIHSLRHQFIYRACDSGIPIHVVQDIVGHESEAVTKIYAKHTSRADKEKHFRKMNGQANGDGYVRIRELVESMNGQNWMKAKAEILEVMK